MRSSWITTLTIMLLLAVSPVAKLAPVKALYLQDGLLMLAIAACAVAVARRGDILCSLRRIPLAAIGMLCVVLMSLAGAIKLGEGGREATKYVLLLALFASVLLASGRDVNVPVLMGWMSLIVAVLLAIGLWQLIRKWEYPISIFENRNVYAGMAAGLVVVGAGFFEDVAGKRGRVATFLLVMISFAVLPSSGWVGISAGLLLLLAFRQTRSAGLVGIAAGVTGVLVSALAFDAHFSRQLANLGLHDPNGKDISQRYLEWFAALNMLSDNPVLGVGAGNYQAFIGKYYELLPKLDTLEYDAQNGWLVIASTTGFAGLCSLAWLFIGGLLPGIRRAREGADIQATILAAAVIAWMAANVMTLVYVRETGPFVMVALALLWRYGLEMDRGDGAGGIKQTNEDR
ncbi:MAG: hypothetical protein C0404_14515 [Verrucomicrobia bacterium]|nr:hypothetical protein [Verrucomicrobiota bacterium]